MSNHASRMHLASVLDRQFARPVALYIQEDWVFIESAEQAQACLNDAFLDKTGPSYTRAMSTCAFALAGQVSPDAVQAALVVAAMEAGFAFEVLEEGAVAFERAVEAAAAKGLEELFLAEAAE